MKIERLPSGTYRVRVYVGKDADGKPHYKSLTGQDKRQLLAEATAYADKNRTYKQAAVLSARIAHYIATREAVLSPSTVRGYNSVLRTLETKYSRFTRLSEPEINRDNLQLLVTEMHNDGLSAKTIRNMFNLISATLKNDGYSVPPVTLPQKTKPVYAVPSAETVQKALQAAKGTRMEIPIALGVLGLRRSEICAVSASDIDDSDILHVHASMVYDAQMHLVEKHTKTYNSDRYIKLPHHIAERIRSDGKATDMTPAALTDMHARFLSLIGVEHFRFHDLRHFFASYCHSIGLPDKTIEYLGGWQSDACMRSVYMQSLDNKKAAEVVLQNMASFFSE